jgi:hypothetical protein
METLSLPREFAFLSIAVPAAYPPGATVYKVTVVTSALA